MEYVIRAEFEPAEFTKTIATTLRRNESSMSSFCKLHCRQGVFLEEPLEETDEETQSGELLSPKGLAFLDVVFREEIEPSATYADLTGKGTMLELTVAYPISHLSWFIHILEELAQSDKVLSYFGCIEDKPKLALDAVGRMSDGDLRYVSLGEDDRRFAPLPEDQSEVL